MAEQDLKLTIREVIHVAKYDGDPPAEGEHKEPAEIVELVYENGTLVSQETTKKEG